MYKKDSRKSGGKSGDDLCRDCLSDGLASAESTEAVEEKSREQELTSLQVVRNR